MKHELPPLPYHTDALEPFVSRETLEYHHGRHHRGYVDKLNKLIAGTPLENHDLDRIVRESGGVIFNQAAQAWNHAFFWKCMTPRHHRISNQCLAAIERDFGSMDQFQDQWVKVGNDVFGSGWLWMVKEDGVLKLVVTHDAMNPLKNGQEAILTCDLWEHAYYIDYRNERAKYLEAFVEVINWNFVEGNLKETEGKAA